MTNSGPTVREVVEDFLGAIAARDFDRAMRAASAQAFEFVGPVKSYQGSQTLRSDLERLYPVLSRLEMRRLFVDESDACAIYDMVTTVPGLELTRMAAWLTVSQGRITRMEVFYDAHAYAKLFDV